jgi:AraC-like DNA-binding protein
MSKCSESVSDHPNQGKMEKIAQQLGYDSEVAFRKAFKREVGITPARYRQLR